VVGVCIFLKLRLMYSNITNGTNRPRPEEKAR
jgi:hypothetical protein